MKKTPPKEHYSDYLQLDKVLSAQKLLSGEAGQPVHEELFFIIMHQVYELWFKQIIADLDSIFGIFKEQASERDMGLILMRLQRINKIFGLLIQQLDVLETLTPLQYMNFRGLLGTMSGFQSHQFRLIEAKFGIKRDERVPYAKCPYEFGAKHDQQEILRRVESELSLFDHVERWLQTLPYLKTEHYDFQFAFQEAFEQMILDAKKSVDDTPGVSKRIEELQAIFQQHFVQAEYEASLQRGEHRLAYKAFLGALFIRLYRNHPLLHVSDLLLTEVMDVNASFLLWRYRHSLMVQKLIGWKKGTGGSSGVHYLQATVEKYDVFADLYLIPMLLLPASYIPLFSVIKEK